MVRKKIIKWYQRIFKKDINLYFGLIFIILTLVFANNTSNCESFNNAINYVINNYNTCEIDSDCTLYEPITNNCEITSSCALSLNHKVNTFVFNNRLLSLKNELCTQDCTSICLPITELTPKCINNLCDFISQ